MTAVSYTFTASGVDSVISAFRSIPKAATDSAAKVSRATDAQARAQERAASTAAKSQERALKHVADVRTRYFTQQQREEERAANARVRAEQKANERIAAERSRMLGKVGALGRQALFYTAGAAAGIATGVVGAAARESIRLGEIANRFAVNAKLAGGNVNAAQTKASFEGVALATPGIKSQEVGEAALAFQAKTGQALDQSQLQVLATTASAAGAKIEDVAAAAATMSEKFDIKKVDQMKEAFATLLEGGAKGAFELKDMASQLESMGAAAQRFGLDKGAGGIKVLGGLAQMARSSTGSSEEASTAVESLFRQLVAESGNLAAGKYGKKIDVFDAKTGKSADILKLLPEIIASTGGKDMQKKMTGLQQIFDARGIRAISPLIEAYATAQKNGTDVTEAMNAVLHKNMDTTMTWAGVQSAASMAQQDASAQLTVAWEQIKSGVSARVVPALLQLVPTIAKLTESGVIESVLTVFQALAESAKLVVDAFEAIGILSPKKKTKAGVLQDAVEAQKRFEAGISNPMSMTKAEIAERRRLRGAVDAASEALMPSADAGAATNANKVFKTFAGAGDFAEQFAQSEAGRVGVTPGSVQYEALLRQGAGIASQIGAGEQVSTGGDAAKELEAQYAQQIAQQKAAEEAAKARTKGDQDAAKAAQELALSLRNVRDEAARGVPLNQR